MKKTIDIIGILLLAWCGVRSFIHGKPIWGAAMLLLVVVWVYSNYFSRPVRLLRMAKNGDAEAQFVVGVGYAFGKVGFEKDLDKAMEWWEKSAGQGNADAAFLLGENLMRESNKNRDAEKAVKWLEQAAHGDIEGAQYLMGLICHIGYAGKDRDLPEAVMWWGKSVKMPESNFFLARAYLLGEGVKENTDEALGMLKMLESSKYEPAKTLLSMWRSDERKARTYALEELKPTAKHLLEAVEACVCDDEVLAGLTGDSTPMLDAVASGDLEAVQKAVADGYDVNKGGIRGVTPLMSVADEGRADMVHLLLAAGADPDAKDEDGYTALFYAVQQGSEEVVRALLDNGADVNGRNGEARVTALMLAALDGRAKLVDVLITAGADVNLQDNNGVTALMAAAQAEHLGIVERLLAAGADIHAKDSDGLTARGECEKLGKKSMAEFLKSKE